MLKDGSTVESDSPAIPCGIIYPHVARVMGIQGVGMNKKFRWADLWRWWVCWSLKKIQIKWEESQEEDFLVDNFSDMNIDGKEVLSGRTVNDLWCTGEQRC